MIPGVFVLILMYWAADGRSSMTTAEFLTQQKCEAAKQAVAKEFDGSWTVHSKTYSVCVPK